MLTQAFLTLNPILSFPVPHFFFVLGSKGGSGSSDYVTKCLTVWEQAWEWVALMLYEALGGVRKLNKTCLADDYFNISFSFASLANFAKEKY